MLGQICETYKQVSELLGMTCGEDYTFEITQEEDLDSVIGHSYEGGFSWGQEHLEISIAVILELKVNISTNPGWPLI